MKQSITPDTLSDFSKITLDKIVAIEKDVMALKLSIIKKLSPTGKKVIKLKGILKSADITDEDIDLAKNALYNKTGI
ncbi:MAG: hypothetical protein HGA41_03880 [Syntrophaceae bacterium]|nr:hypothetical protein [Syntrophaceae bacterium]